MVRSMQPESLKQLVQDAMDSILVAHDRPAVRRHFHPAFVQHNPWAEDGGAHVEAMCDFTFGVKMSRWVVQGDLVAYHGLYTAPNPLGEHPLLCVDVWRVQGEQIVEHWDALRPTPADEIGVMLAGGGDGLAAVPAATVASNAAAARRLLEQGVNGRDAELLRSLMAEGYTGHQPGDEGVQGLLAWVDRERPRYDVRRTIASGELVLTHALVHAGDTERVVFDIFRFDGDGRITDRWSVAQDRVPLADAANPHPHF